ncbi:hypothetical protein C8R44DRAFT_804500 [Mycena epipterygia]|nr:hypothetical protein C8R44DRAFT_804500 [Mycena epipterygia]
MEELHLLDHRNVFLHSSLLGFICLYSSEMALCVRYLLSPAAILYKYYVAALVALETTLTAIILTALYYVPSGEPCPSALLPLGLIVMAGVTMIGQLLLVHRYYSSSWNRGLEASILGLLVLWHSGISFNSAKYMLSTPTFLPELMKIGSIGSALCEAFLALLTYSRLCNSDVPGSPTKSLFLGASLHSALTTVAMTFSLLHASPIFIALWCCQSRVYGIIIASTRLPRDTVLDEKLPVS